MERSDDYYMGLALDLAKRAAQDGEVPVGCVIVRGDEIVGRGKNAREHGKNALLHAETSAIFEACQTIGGWRLWDCTLYVTLEPCPMCAGAIINARIPRVVYGADDIKNGACGSVTDLFALKDAFHPKAVGGVRAEECAALLSDFFTYLRNIKVETWKKP